MPNAIIFWPALWWKEEGLWVCLPGAHTLILITFPSGAMAREGKAETVQVLHFFFPEASCNRNDPFQELRKGRGNLFPISQSITLSCFCFKKTFLLRRSHLSVEERNMGSCAAELGPRLAQVTSLGLIAESIFLVLFWLPKHIQLACWFEIRAPRNLAHET